MALVAGVPIAAPEEEPIEAILTATVPDEEQSEDADDQPDSLDELE